MSITIYQRSSSGMRSIKLHNGYIVGFGLFVAGLVSTAVGGLYANSSSTVYEGDFDRVAIDNWENQIQAQWKEIETAKQTSEQKIDALTARLGMLQAHVRRLNAAGERLLDVSGIDSSEFDFSEEPAIGGPEKALVSESNTVAGTVADLDQSFDHINRSLQSNEQQLKVIESLLMDKQMGTERYISGRPITSGWLSSYYGKRSDPFTGKPAWHGGIDFAGREGDDVIATAAGVVSWVGNRSGYGLLVEINHGDGLSTRYGHNKEFVVKKGEVVKKGQTISKIGNTGRSTGAHVHYEVLKDGRSINPTRYVNRKVAGHQKSSK